MESLQGQKQFECEHCQAAIVVPADLPPTSAPCPICQQVTTSPPIGEPTPSRVEQNAVSPAAVVEENENEISDLPARREEQGTEDKGGSGLLWIIAALAFLLLLAGGLFLLKKTMGKPSEAGVTVPEPISDDTSTVVNVEKEGLDVLNKFLSATTIEERAKFVIGKEDTLAAMREQYGTGELPKSELKPEFFSEWGMDTHDVERGIYLLQYDRPKQFRLSTLFTPVADLRTQYSLRKPDTNLRTKAIRANFEVEAERAQVYLKRVNNELLIDWYTFIQTKNRMFRDFIEYPVAGRKGVFRLGLSEEASSLYEDEGVRNYRLVDPAHNSEDIAAISVKKNSEVGRILEELAWTDIAGKEPVFKGATMELQWSTDTKPQLQISKVICWEFLGVGGDPSNLVLQ